MIGKEFMDMAEADNGVWEEASKVVWTKVSFGFVKKDKNYKEYNYQGSTCQWYQRS